MAGLWQANVELETMPGCATSSTTLPPLSLLFVSC